MEDHFDSSLESLDKSHLHTPKDVPLSPSSGMETKKMKGIKIDNAFSTALNKRNLDK